MKLTELFDNPAEFTKLNLGFGEIEYIFYLNDKSGTARKYGVSFREAAEEKGFHPDVLNHYSLYGGWALDFYMYTPDDPDRDRTLNLTGVNQPVAVFSTLAAILKDFWKGRPDSAVAFVANSKKKLRVYRALIEKLKRTMSLQVDFTRGNTGVMRPEPSQSEPHN